MRLTAINKKKAMKILDDICFWKVANRNCTQVGASRQAYKIPKYVN